MARSYVDPATVNTAATCVGLLTPSIARMARTAMLSWLDHRDVEHDLAHHNLPPLSQPSANLFE
jgi:hypothetical protein